MKQVVRVAGLLALIASLSGCLFPPIWGPGGGPGGGGGGHGGPGGFHYQHFDGGHH